MAQISRLRNAEIANGNLVNADDIAAELDQLVNAHNTNDTTLGDIESGTITISGDKTFSGDNVHSGNNTFSGSNTHTGQENFARTADPGTPVDGDFWYNSTSDVYKGRANGLTKTLATTDLILSNAKGHLWGLTLSNNSGTPNTDIDIASGQCMDDTNTDLMVYAGGTKRLSSAWAVGTGNGASDTGTIPTSGTLHIYVIKRVDTGVVDIFCSTSLSPTLPTNYTLKRRIGSLTTDSSAHMLGFMQYGDRFEYKTVGALDVDVTNQGTSSVSRTLKVPTGIQVEAMINVAVSAGSQVSLYLQNLDLTDTAPSITATPLGSIVTCNNGAGNPWGGLNARVITNTSGQIGTRSNVASTTLKIGTTGWIDNRGRLA